MEKPIDEGKCHLTNFTSIVTGEWNLFQFFKNFVERKVKNNKKMCSAIDELTFIVEKEKRKLDSSLGKCGKHKNFKFKETCDWTQKNSLEIIFDVNQIFETVNSRNSGRLAGVY